MIIRRREIVLYNKHRHTKPIVELKANREKFIFIKSTLLWKMIPVRGNKKSKYIVMYFILSALNPKYIIDINWTTKWQSLYKVWTKKNPSSKFVVIQHGSYRGGNVDDTAHLYTKCDIFLTWGSYFKNLFISSNPGKSLIVPFGNTVYNFYNRDDFSYENRGLNKVLVAPSLVDGARLVSLNRIVHKLETIGLKVFVKPHRYQKEIIGTDRSYQVKSTSIYKLLLLESYDFVLTDHSSVLLDAIFFKNKVLFFNSDIESENIKSSFYSGFLSSINDIDLEYITKEGLKHHVDINAQEDLLNEIVDPGSNCLGQIEKIL